MDRLLTRGQVLLLILSGLYLAFLVLLSIPYFQTYAIFLHWVRLPLFAELDNPIKYGLPARRSVNFRLETRDKLQLGAWLVLPPTEQTRIIFNGHPSSEEISDSLSNRPTILLFHGNAATRAVHFRAQHCSTYASRFRANVLCIDYRGYGDSEGSPSEEGLVIDARAAWDWTISNGSKAEDILLVGLSLGTGVASALGAELAKEGAHPRGIVLLAPFTSLRSLLHDYHILGAIPILQPLQFFPPLQNFFANFLITQFNTTRTLPNIQARILIAHSKYDTEIPYMHSQSLFDGLLEQFLPSAPALPTSPNEMQGFDWATHKAVTQERSTRRSALVKKQEIPGFATIHRLTRANEYGEVLYVEALYGGHDRIGLQESLMDLIDSTFFYYGPLYQRNPIY